MTCSDRDYQKSRVYAWESKVVGPRCPRGIKFEDAQTFVDGIFLCEGLVGAPKIVPLPKQNKKALADATRAEIRIKETVPAWVLIHELAHTLTYTHDGRCDHHGPDFMGTYLRLLDKYMGLSLLLTMYSLKEWNIKFNLVAQPYITDRKAS